MFRKGDAVFHKQMPWLRGTVVRFYKPSWYVKGIVYWKGWDAFDPDRLDWTLEDAMEHDNVTKD